MTKRFSLRFNLDNESERKAWEHLQSAPDSKNKAIISAINAYFTLFQNSLRKVDIIEHLQFFIPICEEVI